MNAETNKIIANAVAGDMLAEKTILECILAKGLLLPKGMEFKDENGNVINATKIVLEKKKKEYPKTYEECCEILEFPTPEMRDTFYENFKELIETVKELL